MWCLLRRYSFLLGVVIFAAAHAQVDRLDRQSDDQRNTASCTLQMRIEGAIGLGAFEYLQRGLKRAEVDGCVSVLLLINTPGGALNTTRLMVERILASPIPILCLVAPEGGHAGSAGAILLMACHVSGAMPATNIGAATPVSSDGDLKSDQRQKALQDTVSWVTGLARLRGRNLDFAEKIVTEAKALDAEAASRAGAIDTVATDVSRFLDFSDGREVQMSAGSKAQVRTGALRVFEPDLRSRVLSFVSDPQIAYLIFMASLALLYFEFTHAGVILPGVIGGIGLLVSLMSFHFLEVRWGSAGLIALGIAFLIAEAFVPSFGALGLGGIVALAVGSILLYEPTPYGAVLPMSLILTTTLLVGGVMLGLAILAYRTRNLRVVHGEASLIGHEGEVASTESPSLRKGMMIVSGEYWHFSCEKDVRVGDRVEVIGQQGLNLNVRPKPEKD